MFRSSLQRALSVIVTRRRDKTFYLRFLRLQDQLRNVAQIRLLASALSTNRMSGITETTPAACYPPARCHVDRLVRNAIQLVADLEVDAMPRLKVVLHTEGLIG